MNTLISLSLLVVLATFTMAQNPRNRKVNDPSITGYCTRPFHKYSGCIYRNSNPDYGINRSPILCLEDIPGFTERSRVCCESIQCGDSNCNSNGGDTETCTRDMLLECGSLRRTYTGNVQI